MSKTPAGWYPVPGGGKRFWDGHTWTSDVLGAPSREAEYQGLDPYLPPPQTQFAPPVATVSVQMAQPQPYVPAQPVTPPGWYQGPTGAMQWWDGFAWGQFAPSAPVAVRPAKETGIAYLFWFLLGGVAAHRFYLGLTGSAVAFNLIWWGGWLLSGLFIGIPLIIAGVIWLLVDLFLIPGLVRSTNASRGYYR